jgi:putative NADPH-quinone reductase
MPHKILILQGHPDAAEGHLCHMLACAYREGALQAGHEVRTVGVSDLDFPLLRSEREWTDASVPASLHSAQQGILWADHLLIVFPLWLGGLPAFFRAFLEQVLRPGFAVGRGPARNTPLLRGRSARVVVTMGMPGLVYRLYFGAHSLRALKRNILMFVGISPVRSTVVGSAKNMTAARRRRLRATMQALGRRAG